MKPFDASRLCSGRMAVPIPFCLLTFQPQSVEAAPTVIYAGGAGVFKSTDGGMNWAGVLNLGVESLAIDPTNPSTLYAGTRSGGGVFKSTDGGGSWTAVNNGLTSSSSIMDIVIDPINPLHALCGDGGFWRWCLQEHRRRSELGCNQQWAADQREPGCSSPGHQSSESQHALCHRRDGYVYL